ncbi:MAG TPA: AIR synthase-related protein, partial [Magnetospirillaceae bacterium]|nr:AIR synthase-related protein [Magnetospirillaceae bacterium]
EAQELARTFNCGIGMVVAVEADRAGAVKAVLEAHGETVYRIGHVRSRLGNEAQSQVLGAEEAWRG